MGERGEQAALRTRAGRRKTDRQGRIFRAPEAAFAGIFLLACLLGLWLLFRDDSPGETLLYVTFPAYAAIAAAEREAEPVFASYSPPQTVINGVPGTPSGEPVETAQTEPPTILIYHTHGTEAYTQTEANPYEPSGFCRTTDNGKNVVAVGEALAQLLRTEYGFAVLHDTANHEPPKLATAYSRSLLTMEAYRRQYPTIRYYIDVHRDAYGKDGSGLTDYVELDGKPCARLMFVVGTGEGATGNGFDEMPDFDSNFSLAERVTAALREKDARLARDIRVKTGRYNQHVSSACLLAEVGHNANTLEQALNAVPYLAAAIARAVGEKQAETLASVRVWAPRDE